MKNDLTLDEYGQTIVSSFVSDNEHCEKVARSSVEIVMKINDMVTEAVLERNKYNEHQIDKDHIQDLTDLAFQEYQAVWFYRK